MEKKMSEKDSMSNLIEKVKESVFAKIIEFPCPKCSEKFQQTVKWFNDNKGFTCICGTQIDVPINLSEFEKFVKNS